MGVVQFEKSLEVVYTRSTYTFENYSVLTLTIIVTLQGKLVLSYIYCIYRNISRPHSFCSLKLLSSCCGLFNC